MNRNADSEAAARIPTATYRLQFNRGFTFRDAEALVPYLAELGISHCYASPYLRARAGSAHGYDIVEHGALNPEIGTAQDFERFTAALARHGMGHILDLVSNHMGVGGNDNRWWLDVLENGPASPYAAYFDIDWHPVKEALRGKVLLPVLEAHYGTVLESGGLVLEFDAGTGAFDVRHAAHRFPLDPATCPGVIERDLEAAAARTEEVDEALQELRSIATSFRHLPPRSQPGAAERAERARDKEIFKRRLAELCGRSPAVLEHLRANVRALNGRPGAPASFDALHALLERQAYRLAYWQVAADEINYRRFFDINELAGLRMEVPEVFESTHRFVLDLVARGRVQGLRVDHPDGLYDPAAYCAQLCAELRRAVGPGDDSAKDRGAGAPPPVYLVVEKILTGEESLPGAWPVHGTTGYDFADAVNGLLVYPAGERELERCYARFTGRRSPYEETVHECRRLIVTGQLSSDLTVLANLLHEIAGADRRTRDYTLNGLRDALTEVIACFPVYRTYVTGRSVEARDRRYVEQAVGRAKRRSPASDVSVFDFLRGVLLLETLDDLDTQKRARVQRFVTRFQQFTAPVMAKAVEDTAFYRDNRLLSLNEPGGDPRRFGLPVAAFHQRNAERAGRWPHALLATSTHDSKRGEDVRARIDVLSELALEWRRGVGRWSRMNHSARRLVDGRRVPTREDEYHLYQVLAGAWPAQSCAEEEFAGFRRRVGEYMLKAAREAKLNTSWINPDAAYEEALAAFVERVLDAGRGRRFIEDFVPFQRRVARAGALNGLAQTLLKLTSPGVPDIYQGNEMVALNLVDPDNRRPVDYAARRRALAELQRACDEGGDPGARALELTREVENGHAKLHLTRCALHLRRERPQLFLRGSYVPLETSGARAGHLCAFQRVLDGEAVIAVAPRWFARLTGPEVDVPLGEAVWSDTRVDLPDGPARAYRNVLTGEPVSPRAGAGGAHLAATDLFGSFPVALLASER